jgi:hypothetical protein
VLVNINFIEYGHFIAILSDFIALDEKPDAFRCDHAYINVCLLYITLHIIIVSNIAYDISIKRRSRATDLRAYFVQLALNLEINGHSLETYN